MNSSSRFLFIVLVLLRERRVYFHVFGILLITLQQAPSAKLKFALYSESSQDVSLYMPCSKGQMNVKHFDYYEGQKNYKQIICTTFTEMSVRNIALFDQLLNH